MEHTSGVGVLDKAVLVLDAVQAGAHSLAALTEATGLSRATAHRLAVALEVHLFLAREGDGRWKPGPRLAAAGTDSLLDRAAPVLARLRDVTGESAQLYRRQGDQRLCVAAADLGSGLRDTVPVGALLPMSAGSAAQVLLAFTGGEPPTGAPFTERTLAEVRRRGWAHSVGERESGVASVSAPVFGPDGRLIGAVSVSGPLERLTRQPGRLHAAAVLTAAKELS
ncbi:MAG: putative transcriptional regulator, IclR [Frankiales bacterium]|nr:putative transcriptional regulator, IclR [Frankiales bacterium]